MWQVLLNISANALALLVITRKKQGEKEFMTAEQSAVTFLPKMWEHNRGNKWGKITHFENSCGMISPMAFRRLYDRKDGHFYGAVNLELRY